MPVIEQKILSPSLNLWHAARDASVVMRLAGEYREAEHYARESLRVAQEAHLAEEDPRAGNPWEALGEALDGQKKYAEALPALQRAVACYRRAGPAWASKADEIQTIDAR